MNAQSDPTQKPDARHDELDTGLSPEEKEALKELRASYPYVEFLDSQQELRRLRFMKWIIRHSSES